MLAVAFLGPAAAFVVLVVSEIVGVGRTSATAGARSSSTSPASPPPIAARRRSPSRRSTRRRTRRRSSSLLARRDRRRPGAEPRDRPAARRDARRAHDRAAAAARLIALLPTFGISAALTLAIAEGYIVNGLAALAFLLVVIATVAYMSRLVTLLARAGARVREPLVGHPVEPDPHARRARPSRRPPLRGRRALLPRHRRPRADAAARPGARAHRRPAARHRQVRAVRPRDGARRRADATRTGAASAATPTSARTCCATSASSGPSARSCAATTSASTAAATRAG